MRILFVTDNGFCKKNDKYYYSAPNVAHISNLHSFFDEFIVVARDDSYANGYSEVPNYVKVSLVPSKNILELRRVLKEKIQECDAVICYGTNGYFASVVGKNAGKVVISYNGGDPYDFCISRGNLKGKLLAPIARYMCKKSFDNSDFGHYCDEFLFDRYPAKGEMLACSGVDIACEEEVLENRLSKIKGFDASGAIKIGLTGHTKNSLKGIDIAIRAISELSENYSLEIAGRGETDKLMELAQRLNCAHRIHFLGALAPGDELMSWLDSLDIYIQPSRIEGLPRATIEAMSRGCPIAASNAGALSKLINPEFIFDLKESEKLSALITKLSDPNVMASQAKENFTRAKNYERSVRDAKYAAFYTKVIDEINNRRNE